MLVKAAGILALGLSQIASCTPLNIPHRPRQDSGGKRVTFQDVFSGNFTVKRTSLQWTSQGIDGNYVDQDPATGNLNLANIVTGNSTLFVAASDVEGVGSDYYDYSIQPSG